MQSDDRPAVGIDLGTTYSVIAHLDAEGRPRTIPSAEGDLSTPSAVLFERSGVIVGKEALKASSLEPEHVALFAKRDMGGAVYAKPIRGQYLPPEVVQAYVLRKLKADAELAIGPVRQVVITAPAYFNEPRRKATQDAAYLADLDAIDIINEPTAAAIAYGIQHGLTPRSASSDKLRVLVYDLGGGTFDVTLMQIDRGHYSTLATAGDVYLGGIDWDRRVADYLAERFLERHGGDDPRDDPAANRRLMQEAEDAKRALSVRGEVHLQFEHHGHVLRLPLTRGDFERLTADLVERTRFTAARLLTDCKMKWNDVAKLLLTGGSTRMPMVTEMLERETGLKVDRSLSADEAVAHGAAIYAGLLQAEGSKRKVSLQKVTNVNSHPLGVLGVEAGTGRPRVQVLVPRNTPLPVGRRTRCATRNAGQRSVVVNVVEGGDASGHNSTPIGKCVVSDLPPDLPAGSFVDVTFLYAADGRLTVEASLPDIGRRATMTLERVSGLTEDALADWKARLDAGLTFASRDERDELLARTADLDLAFAKQPLRPDESPRRNPDEGPLPLPPPIDAVDELSVEEEDGQNSFGGELDHFLRNLK